MINSLLIISDMLEERGGLVAHQLRLLLDQSALDQDELWVRRGIPIGDGDGYGHGNGSGYGDDDNFEDGDITGGGTGDGKGYGHYSGNGYGYED